MHVEWKASTTTVKVVHTLLNSARVGECCQVLLDSFRTSPLVSRIGLLCRCKFLLYLVNEPFARKALPFIVHDILVQDPSTRDFFSDVFAEVSDTIVLDVVLFLRRQVNGGNAFTSNSWLRVDFASLARVAIDVGEYTTALLFCCIHKDISSSRHGIDEIVLTCFERLNDIDNFTGASVNIQVDPARKYRTCGDWMRLLSLANSTGQGGVEWMGMLGYYSFLPSLLKPGEAKLI